MKLLIYVIIGIIILIALLKIFWPLIWIIFLCYIGYSMYRSFVLSKRKNYQENNSHKENNYYKQTKRKSDDIIDVEYTEVVEEEIKETK